MESALLSVAPQAHPFPQALQTPSRLVPQAEIQSAPPKWYQGIQLPGQPLHHRPCHGPRSIGKNGHWLGRSAWFNHHPRRDVLVDQILEA